MAISTSGYTKLIKEKLDKDGNVLSSNNIYINPNNIIYIEELNETDTLIATTKRMFVIDSDNKILN